MQAVEVPMLVNKVAPPLPTQQVQEKIGSLVSLPLMSIPPYAFSVDPTMPVGEHLDPFSKSPEDEVPKLFDETSTLTPYIQRRDTATTTDSDVSGGSVPNGNSGVSGVSGICASLPADKSRTSRKRSKRPMTATQRQSHNKIERKYRININSKIASLQRMVPWMSQDGVAFETHCSEEIKAARDSGKKLNKSMILDMVTEYIGYLQEELRKKDEEIARLSNTSFEACKET